VFGQNVKQAILIPTMINTVMDVTVMNNGINTGHNHSALMPPTVYMDVRKVIGIQWVL